MKPSEALILHRAVDQTPYKGMEFKAWPGMTISRGEVVWSGRPGEGSLHGAPGRGQFLRCDRPATAKAAPRPGAKRGWLTALEAKAKA